MSDTGPVTLPFKCAFEASFAVIQHLLLITYLIFNQFGFELLVLCTGFPQALEIMENLENH